MAEDYGHFTFYCAHEGCDKPSVSRKYGIDCCEDHLADQDPSTWPANQDDFMASLGTTSECKVEGGS